jgi:PLP dependent protein
MGAVELTIARRRIADAATRSGRDPGDVTLVVVCKGRSDAQVAELYEAGQRLFAENRAEALVRRVGGPLPDDIVWHFVGSVQRRKAKLVAPIATLLHSMDREALEATWAAQQDPPPVLLQVNLAEEPQKHGYRRDEVVGAAKRLEDHGVLVRGLMTLPPAPAVPEDSRPWFTQLAALGAELGSVYPGATELSMGMTDDFEVAVECGATMVRLGRTIFEPGEREIESRPAEG